MDSRSWLKRGQPLPDNSVIRNLEICFDEVQVLLTSYESYVLVVQKQLLRRWIEQGLVSDTLFTKVDSSKEDLFWFISKPDYIVSSLQYGPFPIAVIDAQAFAIALRETRKILADVSFLDAIYIEQISRLLPLYRINDEPNDKLVLGTWLSGGVHISTDDIKRLSQLVGWMNISDLKSVVANAGFEVPQDGRYLIKHKSQDMNEEEETTVRNKYKQKRTGGTLFRLPGRPFLEEFFNENVIDIIFNIEKYKKMGIEFPSAIILHGPPGCGKTYAVDKLIEFINWPSYSIDSSSVASPYIHDTSKKISEVFDQAMENAPSVIVIDEMEAYLSDRGTRHSGLHHVEEVAEFLRLIPKAINSQVLIIAMTNKIDMIDPAILSRGRFDHIIEIGMPSFEEAKVLLQTLLEKLPVSADIDIDFMAINLKGRPLSDVAFTVREAGRIAVKKNKPLIDNECMIVALQNTSNVSKDEPKRIGFQ